MKKDKENHHPVPESMASVEPITSSVRLALQQFRKEAEKKEVAQEAAKARCPVCFKEIAPKRLCSGHGRGSGKGDSATSDKTTGEKASPGEDNSLNKSPKVVGSTDELIDEFGSEERDLGSSFDPEIIAELIVKGLLLIDSNRESMTLTIKLQCEASKLTEEQREELKKFTQAIIKEFNEFKEENHLADDCIQIIKDENGNICSLLITMPSLTVYDAFIQRLANNLVPIPKQRAQEKDEITKMQGLTPNSLLMEPRPINKDESSTQARNEEIHHKSEDEEQEIFNPSPFNMKPW